MSGKKIYHFFVPVCARGQTPFMIFRISVREFFRKTKRRIENYEAASDKKRTVFLENVISLVKLIKNK